MKRILLVDDLRIFREPDESAHLYIARTSEQALTILQREVEPWDEIWLDHDLGDATGEIDDVMRVVDYLSERAFNDEPVVVGVVYVHTSNPSGRANMLRALTRFGYHAQPLAAETHFYVPEDAAAPDENAAGED